MNKKNSKTKQKSLQCQVIDAFREAKSLEWSSSSVLRFRRVKITSDYNGQPYGRSKKSLKGNIAFIRSVTFDFCHDEPCLFLQDENGKMGPYGLAISIKEIEFIDEVNNA